MLHSYFSFVLALWHWFVIYNMHSAPRSCTIDTIFLHISKDHDKKPKYWNVECEIPKCEENENENNGKKNI